MILALYLVSFVCLYCSICIILLVNIETLHTLLVYKIKFIIMLAHSFTNNIRNNVSFVSLYCNICIILLVSTGTVQILFVYKIKFITMLVDKVTLIKLLSSISSILPIVNLHTNIVSAHSNTFFIMLIYTVTFFAN